MDTGHLITIAYEMAYFLAVFLFFMLFALTKGRQAVINVIFGLYLSLLIVEHFPNYQQFFVGFDTITSAWAQLGLFAVITVLTTALSSRVMPSEFRENRFESIFRKVFLALSATALVCVFSFQILPVSTFLTPSTPLQQLFGPTEYFFWWLLAPLVVLFFV